MRIRMMLAALLLTAVPAAAQESELERARGVADDLMIAMGYDVWLESMPEVYAEASARSLTSCTPRVPEQEVREYERILREELVAAGPRVYERIRDSYARRLSLEELEAMVAFYETEVGQRIAKAAVDLTYDQFLAQVEIDRAGLRASERMGWCDNAL